MWILRVCRYFLISRQMNVDLLSFLIILTFGPIPLMNNNSFHSIFADVVASGILPQEAQKLQMSTAHKADFILSYFSEFLSFCLMVFCVTCGAMPAEIVQLMYKPSPVLIQSISKMNHPTVTYVSHYMQTITILF